MLFRVLPCVNFSADTADIATTSMQTLTGTCAGGLYDLFDLVSGIASSVCVCQGIEQLRKPSYLGVGILCGCDFINSFTAGSLDVRCLLSPYSLLRPLFPHLPLLV